MASTTKHLSDIQKEVYLRVNDLLRLRRVCKWMKRYVDDYLRMHPRSRDKLTFNFGLKKEAGEEETDEDMDKALEYFLKADSHYSIRKPVSSLEIVGTSTSLYGHPLVFDFLEKYGHQLTQVEVSVLTFPLSPSVFEFYEKLPKLISFKGRITSDGDTDEVTGTELTTESITFPRTFRNVRKLEVWTSRRSIEISPLLWKLVEFCKRLEHFAIPKSGGSGTVAIQELRKILDRREHKQLRYLSTAAVCAAYDDPSSAEGMLRNLMDMAIKHDLKLLNFNFVTASHSHLMFHDNQVTKLNQLKDRVVSLRCILGLDDYARLALPNVQGVFALLFWQSNFEFFQTMMGQTVLPRLRKLELVSLSAPLSLEAIWTQFPALEEISLQFGLIDGDSTENIFGSMDAEEDPCFLRLTNLRKLTLDGRACLLTLTDMVFSRVLCHMKLQELYRISADSVQSFTTAGVRELLNPDFPFVTSIQMFPFGNWSLDGVGTDEFQLLAKQFPCNQF